MRVSRWLAATVAVLASGTAAVAMGWQITIGGRGAPSLAAIATALLGVVILWRTVLYIVRTGGLIPEVVNDDLPDEGGAHGTVVVVAGPHDVTTIRAAVLAGRVARGVDRVIVADEFSRNDVREFCARWLVPLAQSVNDALIVSRGAPVALAEANHAVLPDIFERTVPLLNDGAAFVQGPVPDGDPLGLWRDRVSRPRVARLGAARFAGTAVVLDPDVLLAAGGVRPDRRGGALATTIALAAAGERGVAAGVVLVTAVRSPSMNSWRAEQTRLTSTAARVLRSTRSPFWARDLSWRQRALLADEVADHLRGLAALAAVGVIVAALLTGRLPSNDGAGGLVIAAIAALAIAALHVARSPFGAGAFAGDALASIVAQMRGVRRSVGRSPLPAVMAPLRAGARPEGRIDPLIGIVLAGLGGAVAARAAALRFHRVLPLLGPAATAIAIAAGILAIALMLVGVGIRRRPQPPWPVVAPAVAASEPPGLDIARLDLDVVEFDAVAPPTEGARAALRLPTRVATLSTAAPWRGPTRSHRWRFGGPYRVSPPAAADELVIDLVVTQRFGPLRSGSDDLVVVPRRLGRGAAACTALGLAGVAILVLWPHRASEASISAQLIRGTVFSDQNLDGRRQASVTLTEPGVNGARVTATDDSGRVVASGTTDADGHFALSITGHTTRVLVRFVEPAGYSIGPRGPESHSDVQIAAVGDQHVDLGLVRASALCPAGSTSTSGPSTAVSTTSPANTLAPTTTSEGEVPAVCVAAPVEVGDMVWADTNGDGIRQPSEPPLAGVTVELWKGAALVGTAVSDAAGRYSFSSNVVEPASGNGDDLGGGLEAGSAFEVRVPHVAGTTPQGSLGGLVPTSPRAAHTNQNLVDSGGWPRGDGDVAVVSVGGAGEVDHAVNFGFTTPMSVGDRVFDDLNGNGVLDPGEPGLANVSVILYADANGDGVPEVPALANTTTSGDGHYLFTGLQPGNYVVDLTGLPAGYLSSVGSLGRPTGPYEGPNLASASVGIDGDDDGTTVSAPGQPLIGRSRPFTLRAGEAPIGELDRPVGDPAPDAWSDLTIDFGFFKAALVGGSVWNDANADGIHKEPATSATDGVVVTILTPDGRSITTAITGDKRRGFAPGSYTVGPLPTGDYVVAFSNLPPGATFSPANQGKVAATMSSVDPATGRSAVVHLVPGQVNDAVNAGWHGVPMAIGDLVWNDANDNGIVDAGEVGVDGVTVRLFAADGVTKAAPDTVTSAGGHYLFTGLSSGDYIVDVQPPSAGWRASDHVPAAADNANHGHAIGPGVHGAARAVVHLVAGQAPSGEPATPGHKLPAGLADANADSTIDVGLVPSPDLSVTLGIDAATASSPGPYVAGQDLLIAVTARNNGPGRVADGWRFGAQFPSGIAPTAVVSASSGASCTLGAGALSCTVANGTGPTDPAATAVVRATLAADPLTAGSSEVEIHAQVAPAATDQTVLRPISDPNTDGVARLVVPLATTGIGGIAWNDRSHDGVHHPAEPGLAQISVRLFDSTGAEVPVGLDGVLGTADDAPGGVITSSSGRYHFTGLAPASYTVEFGAVPIGLVVSPRAQGTDRSVDSDADPTSLRTDLIAVAAGSDIVDIDLGLHRRGGSVGDTVWSDANRNDLQDAGEPGVAGVAVGLLHGDGTAVLDPTGNPETAVTDAGGHYRFAELDPGDYQVAFALPGGNERVKAKAGGDDTTDSDADPVSGITHSFTLSAGSDITTVDAGLRPLIGAVGGMVWQDANGNGLADAGENPIPNAKVDLIDGAGNVAATTATGTDGHYRFDNVSVGTYVLKFDRTTLPAGSGFTTQGAARTSEQGSDADPIDGSAGPVHIGAGTADLSWDAGVVAQVHVSGSVWIDDGNGHRDASEPAVPGAPVVLVDTAGAQVALASTDAAGSFSFDGIAAGKYSLTLGSLPVGDQYTTASTGGSEIDPATGRTALFDVAAGSTAAHSIGIVQPRASFAGNVWIDEDGNTLFGPDETAVSGEAVTVTTGSGAPVTAVVTDSAGHYVIGGLPGGDYRLRFGPVTGLERVAGTASDGLTDPLTLKAGASHVLDVRWRRPPSDLDSVLAAAKARARADAKSERAARIVIAAMALAVALWALTTRRLVARRSRALA